MPTNWKNRLTHWQPHREGGTVFSLAHLHPFAFTHWILRLPAAMPREESR